MRGPGAYDPEASSLQRVLGAQGVIVIVVEGSRGNGFSVAATAEVIRDIPGMLRFMADEIALDAVTLLLEETQ